MFLSGKTTKMVEYIANSLLLLLFVFGGLGLERRLVVWVGGVVSLLLLVIVWRIKGKLKIPKYWWVYLVWVGFSFVSLMWSTRVEISLMQSLLYLIGGVVWLSVSNLPERWGRGGMVVVTAGLVFGVFYLLNGVGAFDCVGSSLVCQETEQHNHIGDWWAVTMLPVIYQVAVMKRKFIWWIVLVGVYFLIMSMSRSAYLATFVGLMVLAKEIKKPDTKKIGMAVAVLTLVVSLVVGASKTILFSRPYFIQAVVGLFKYPFGVGLGNFRIISWKVSEMLPGFLYNFSAWTHNWILEVFAGLGWVGGILFVVWLFKLGKVVLSSKEGLVKAMWVATAVNFMFDFTYAIPAMLWLFFYLLGVVQEEKTE